MHLNDGMCGSIPVHPASAIERMHADRIGNVYGGSTPFGVSSGFFGYGMGWFVYDYSITGKWLTDPGAYGSFPYIDDQRNIAVFTVLENSSTLGRSLHEYIREPIEDVIDGNIQP